MGPAITPELSDRGGGRFQKFENSSSFYWNPKVDNGNAHQVGGAIRDSWGAHGWEVGSLNYPITNELVAGKGGRFNRFQGGSIYWTLRTGPHVMQGSFLNKWGGKGWENGALGYPTLDATHLPPTSGNSTPGDFQRFEGGNIYKTEAGTFIVWGAILDKWGAQGYENGKLGYPVTDESWMNGKFTQQFERGEISWP